MPPEVTLKSHATRAPNVTISPWAKLAIPVVPKISDSPMAAIAMMSPNRMPWKVRRAARSAVVDTLRSAASPKSSGNSTLRDWPGAQHDLE